MDKYNMANPNIILRDYEHAARTFVDGDMRLSPKSQFLYHVAFNLTSTEYFPVLKLIEAGMMAKNVALPKFSIDSKTYNAYNRVNIVQSKIKYDPVNITFHDDMGDVVRDFWVMYYNYYYADSQHAASVYSAAYKYAPNRPADSWGYRSTVESPLISAVRIYQLYKRRFTEYVLVNPIITSLVHGQQQAGSSEPVETQMTLAFETVKYASGSVTEDTVSGFALFHYDKNPSPITGPGGGILPVGDGTAPMSGDLSDIVRRGTPIGGSSGLSTVTQARQAAEQVIDSAAEPVNGASAYFFPGT
jgi:hypothetical protein